MVKIYPHVLSLLVRHTYHILIIITVRKTTCLTLSIRSITRFRYELIFIIMNMNQKEKFIMGYFLFTISVNYKI